MRFATSLRGTWIGIAALAASLAACSSSNTQQSTGGGGTGTGASTGTSGTGASTATGGQGGSGGSMPVVPAGHPRVYLNDANKKRLASAITDGQAAAVRFRDMVDGQLAGADYYAFAPHYAAILGALGGDGAYCKYAVDHADAVVTAEEALIANGERAEVAGDSYLYVGETVGDLALVYDWCFDVLTEDQRSRWIAYGNQAIRNVWDPEGAEWGGISYSWSGWSIDNPSNNYYYSFLRATMLLGLATKGENPDAETWIERFRVDKIEKQLVPAFEADLKGGGSREGTGYGVSMRGLFELYDIWEATTGERIWNLTGHTRASLPNMIHMTVPTLDRIAPIGDHARDSTASLFDYHRAYVLVLARLLGPSDPLSDVAQTWLDGSSVPEMSQAFMFITDFLYADPAHAKRPLSDMHPSYHAPGTGSVFFRSAWDESASWGAFLAGPFTESHAHRDQGSLLVYRGDWLGYDQNISSHSGIFQDETAHNLVRIEQGGSVVPMHNGTSTLAALRDIPGAIYMAADITPIYGGDAAVTRVEREVVFLPSHGTFVVMDRVDTTGSAEAVWALNAPVAPTAVASGYRIDNAGAQLAVRPLAPASPTGTVVDWAAVDADMNAGFRIDLRDPAAAGKARFLVVLANPTTLGTASLVSDAATLGANIAWTDGSSADIVFGRDTMGVTAHVVVGGAVLHDGAIPLGVDAIPLLDVP